MTKPRFLKHLAILTLLSCTQFVTLTARAGDNDVPVVVKIGGIPWFTAMGKGIKEAGKETGLNATHARAHHGRSGSTSSDGRRLGC